MQFVVKTWSIFIIDNKKRKTKRFSIFRVVMWALKRQVLMSLINCLRLFQCFVTQTTATAQWSERKRWLTCSVLNRWGDRSHLLFYWVSFLGRLCPRADCNWSGQLWKLRAVGTVRTGAPRQDCQVRLLQVFCSRMLLWSVCPCLSLLPPLNTTARDLEHTREGIKLPPDLLHLNS